MKFVTLRTSKNKSNVDANLAVSKTFYPTTSGRALATESLSTYKQNIIHGFTVYAATNISCIILSAHVYIVYYCYLLFVLPEQLGLPSSSKKRST